MFPDGLTTFYNLKTYEQLEYVLAINKILTNRYHLFHLRHGSIPNGFSYPLQISLKGKDTYDSPYVAKKQKMKIQKDELLSYCTRLVFGGARMHL